jgi:hypothetical protein
MPAPAGEPLLSIQIVSQRCVLTDSPMTKGFRAARVLQYQIITFRVKMVTFYRKGRPCKRIEHVRRLVSVDMPAAPDQRSRRQNFCTSPWRQFMCSVQYFPEEL